MDYNSIALAVSPSAPVDSCSVPVSGLHYPSPHSRTNFQGVVVFCSAVRSSGGVVGLDLTLYIHPSMCERDHDCCLHVSADICICMCVHSIHKFIKSCTFTHNSHAQNTYSHNAHTRACTHPHNVQACACIFTQCACVRATHSMRKRAHAHTHPICMRVYTHTHRCMRVHAHTHNTHTHTMCMRAHAHTQTMCMHVRTHTHNAHACACT